LTRPCLARPFLPWQQQTGGDTGPPGVCLEAKEDIGPPINAWIPIFSPEVNWITFKHVAVPHYARRSGVTHVGHIWSVAWQKYYQLRQMTWKARWSVPLIILGLGVSLAFWRAVSIETELTMTAQVDYENATLCAKFGFARGTEKHAACKLDLLDLRRSDEELLAATSLP
jgi:hypothetical protein